MTLLHFVLCSLTSFSQGEWIEEVIDPDTGLRTGKIEINGVIATINPGIPPPVPKSEVVLQFKSTKSIICAESILSLIHI